MSSKEEENEQKSKKDKKAKKKVELFPPLKNIERAKEELEYIHLYDKVIVNKEGQVEEAFNELYDILNSEQVR